MKMSRRQLAQLIESFLREVDEEDDEEDDDLFADEEDFEDLEDEEEDLEDEEEDTGTDDEEDVVNDIRLEFNISDSSTSAKIQLRLKDQKQFIVLTHNGKTIDLNELYAKNPSPAMQKTFGDMSMGIMMVAIDRVQHHKVDLVKDTLLKMIGKEEEKHSYLKKNANLLSLKRRVLDKYA